MPRHTSVRRQDDVCGQLRADPGQVPNSLRTHERAVDREQEEALHVWPQSCHPDLYRRVHARVETRVEDHSRAEPLGLRPYVVAAMTGDDHDVMDVDRRERADGTLQKRASADLEQGLERAHARRVARRQHYRSYVVHISDGLPGACLDHLSDDADRQLGWGLGANRQADR